MEREDTEGETCCVCVEGETVVYVERDIGMCGGRHKCICGVTWVGVWREEKG